MKRLQERLLSLDMNDRGGTIGADYAEGRITVPILGKQFTIDHDSNVTTEIHV